MGYPIVSRRELSSDSVLLVVKAPHVAQSAKPGQFIILRTCEEGERVPLTIANTDSNEGTVTIMFQVVGKTTRELAGFELGQEICDFLGPLGVPTEIENFGSVVAVGGGFGAAVLYPLVKALKAAGNRITIINGARSENLLILEDELQIMSDEYYVTTDDGSKGRGGFVTDVLSELISTSDSRPQRVFAVGPVPMMRAVAETTRPAGIKTIVSLNPIMVDGTGMCGACRVEIGGQTKFACVDGPEFDAHQVNFDLLGKRLSMYKAEEAQCLARMTGKDCRRI